MGNSPKMSPTECDGNTEMHSNGSWRQAILHRVVTPNKEHDKKNGKSENSDANETPRAVATHRTREELRDLWKKAINQQVILIRMEKENARLKGIIIA